MSNYYSSRASSRRAPSRGRPQNFNRSRSNSRQPKKDYINPSRFIQSAKVSDSTTEYIPQHQFADFSLRPLIHDNLGAMGYKKPSPIQDQAIPAGLLGKDVVGIANTGTGKTAAFATPVINRLIGNRADRAIILAPTRELAQQIEEQCRKISRGSGLRGALLIGGVSMGPQLRDLRNNPQLIIGTPGRVKDHMERHSLNLKNCNMVVLDEVDRMLDMGFVHDIRHILGSTSPARQSFYFSATLDARVKAIIEGFSSDPVQITIKSGDTSENVEQNIITYSSTNEKIDKLHDLLIQETVTKTLVFDDTHRSVEKLAKELETRGFVANAIHGGKTQGQRQRVLKSFRDNQIKVLVATDVAARGLDVSDITHVVNYSLPQTYSDYIHRIGRTGRSGKAGNALTFVEKSTVHFPSPQTKVSS